MIKPAHIKPISGQGKRGNSIGIPQAFMKRLNLRKGDQVLMTEEKGIIIIKPIGNKLKLDMNKFSV